ncbi:GNAT family N-acetyltransferase [Nitrincola sp. MINF-07-Sa-05]|uniref:GNAT family N-acetyltransferase n=1 Tax=Nitrincola salilacus TaxID=3400273 RepID=UPI0039184A4E
MNHVFNHLNQPIGESLAEWTRPDLPPGEPMEGHYCQLEPLDPEVHAESLHEANLSDVDGRSWTYLPYGPFESVKAYKDWMVSSCQSTDPMFFAIRRKSDNKLVGVASYLRITPASGSIEVGHIHYSDHLKRSPVATESMFLMMKRVFELGYRRYEWKCDALNGPSRDAAQRLGFSYEGIFRQATVYKGRNRDTAWYAIIDSEWPALHRAFSEWLDPNNFDENGQQRCRLSDLTRPVLKQPR